MALTLVLPLLVATSLWGQNVRPYLPGNDDYDGVTLPVHYRENFFPGSPASQSAASDSDNTPADNPTTDAGARLGRVLFYEKKLSLTGAVSCASCHQQQFGFSDPNRLSIGHTGGTTRRHSMALVNGRFYQSGKFFWDERAATLEEQVLQPIQDATEMGLTLAELISVVEGESYYAPLFSEAFGDESVTTDRISKALAQFIRSLVSVDSKYDRARGDVNDPLQPFPDFTPSENRGKQIFMQRENRAFACIDCHVSEAFVGANLINPGDTTSATNNGLDPFSVLDLGVEESTGNVNDAGKFKVPSLKNIAIRPPYMHDGSLTTLGDVVRHYDRGVENHVNLSPPLRNPNNPGSPPAQLNLSRTDRDALVNFMETLTDDVFLTDPKFSDPFQPLWEPSGWHYLGWPYAYDSGAQRWHYFSENASNTNWHANLTTGAWDPLNTASGWCYFNGPYFYSFETSTWHYYGAGNDQWSVDLSTGDWSLFVR